MRDHEDWRARIIGRFPPLFASNASARLSGLLEIGVGWEAIIEQTLVRLLSITNECPGTEVVIDDVAQKYGTLRVQVRGNFNLQALTRAPVELAVDLAEARSAVTCEMCGDEGALHEQRGWLSTRCPLHAVGFRVPIDAQRAGLLVRRRFVHGRLRVESVRRYDRLTDSLVDLNPASIGLEDF